MQVEWGIMDGEQYQLAVERQRQRRGRGEGEVEEAEWRWRWRGLNAEPGMTFWGRRRSTDCAAQLYFVLSFRQWQTLIGSVNVNSN